MKTVGTDRLNQFWREGILPIIESLAKKLGLSQLANNMLTTEEGFVMDARQGPVIQGQIDEVRGDVDEINGKLSGFIRVINVATSQITVPATGGVAIDAQVNVPEGYSLVEVFPRSTTNMVWLTCDCYKTGAKTCKFSLYNHYSQDLPGTGYGYAIVVKK